MQNGRCKTAIKAQNKTAAKKHKSHLLRVFLPPRLVLRVREVPEVVHRLTARFLVVEGGVERVLVGHRGGAAQVVMRLPSEGPLPTAAGAGAADGVRGARCADRITSTFRRQRAGVP